MEVAPFRSAKLIFQTYNRKHWKENIFRWGFVHRKEEACRDFLTVQYYCWNSIHTPFSGPSTVFKNLQQKTLKRKIVLLNISRFKTLSAFTLMRDLFQEIKNSHQCFLLQISRAIFLRQKSSTKSIIRVILNCYNYQHAPSFRRTKPTWGLLPVQRSHGRQKCNRTLHGAYVTGGLELI